MLDSQQKALIPLSRSSTDAVSRDFSLRCTVQSFLPCHLSAFTVDKTPFLAPSSFPGLVHRTAFPQISLKGRAVKLLFSPLWSHPLMYTQVGLCMSVQREELGPSKYWRILSISESVSWASLFVFLKNIICCLSQ